ncbi:MAG: deoxyribose-phosphate aldolase [Bacteroidota bacterium]
MDIRQYLDATYLKTPEQAQLTDAQNRNVVRGLVQEAIHEKYKLVMVRPDMVAMARYLIDEARSDLLVGTVVSFPEGTAVIPEKIAEAEQAIFDGADDLDFVINYTAFIAGDIHAIEQEVLQCTAIGLQSNKTVKWIIEIAALNDAQVAVLTSLVKDVVVSNFEEKEYSRVFVKSSTGFYKTQGTLPNGATVSGIKIMLDNAGPLSVKASGGVKNYAEAVAMINMGVMRIGTSSAKEIVHGQDGSGSY